MRNRNRLTWGSAPNRAREAWQRPGTFKSRHPKRGGRKDGTPNVITRELKSAVIMAAHRLGSDLKGKDGVLGYLTRLAKHEDKTFVMLLRAVLPLQMKAITTEQRKKYITPDGKPIFRDMEKIEQGLRENGWPVLLMRLEPAINAVRSGMSPSDAMLFAGLNSRLERIPEEERREGLQLLFPSENE